jgi:hypothetical protein
MKRELITLANHLDEHGAKEESDLIDVLLQSLPVEILIVAPEAEMENCETKEDEKKEAAFFSDMLEKLAVIADTLDTAGLVEEAELVDSFIQKTAKDVLKSVVDWKKENPKTEQSHRYDSKYHHEQQIYDPKKPTPSVKEHHVKTYQPIGQSLSTRHCPLHIGVPLVRIGEGLMQCSMDGEIYNWEVGGWTDYQGNKSPGGSVAGQTPSATQYEIPSRIFDSREVNINRGD